MSLLLGHSGRNLHFAFGGRFLAKKKIFVIMHIIQCVTPKMKFIHNYKKKKMGGLNFGLEP